MGSYSKTLENNVVFGGMFFAKLLLFRILVYFGFGLAIFAIIQKATWNGKLYWFRELSLGGEPFGPFVNRNHYAGFINMLIPLSLGLAVMRRSRGKQTLFGFFGIIMAVSLFISFQGVVLSVSLQALPCLLFCSRGKDSEQKRDGHWRFLSLQSFFTCSISVLTLL